jgi:hypothetical protein
LTNDIDLSGADWIPIGTIGLNSSFRGVFDGQGYVIRNMAITGDIEAAGLFGVTNSATIRNIGIENSNINISTNRGGAYAGGVVGIAYWTIIDNCYNTGSISASYPGGATTDVSAGGIVGSTMNTSATISNCYNTGSVSASAGRVTGAVSRAYAGGIVGSTRNTGIVSNSFNSGSVSAFNAWSSDFAYIGDISGD